MGGEGPTGRSQGAMWRLLGEGEGVTCATQTPTRAHTPACRGTIGRLHTRLVGRGGG